MKKFLLWQVLAVLFTVFGTNAQEPSFNWAKLIDGKGSDGAYTLAKAADGDVFIATNFASEGEDLTVSYGDEVVATGAPNTATSGNRNMLLQKIKADGNYEWNAYTNMGDVASAQLTATADGGVLVAIKARYTNRNEDGKNRLLSYVAPDGTQTDIKMDNPVLPGWIYQGILLKVSDSGELLWSKILRFDYPTVDDKMVTDGFDLNAAAVDAEGNIYLGGNFSVTATFDKADGETATVEPQYTGDFGNGLTGDGGLLLAKFDAEGNYLKHFSTTGKAVKENVFGLEFDGGQLYALVQLKGTGSDAVEFGGKAIEPTAFDDVVVINMDNDFNVNWATAGYATAFTDGKHTTQIKGMDIINGNIYVSGAVKGGFAAAKDGEPLLTTSKTSLEGYVLEFAADGSGLTSGYIHGGGISGYFNVMKNGDKVLAYGYSWVNNQGIVLVEFSNSEAPKVTSIATMTGMPTAWRGLVDGSTLYAYLRGNQEFLFYKSDFHCTPAGWGMVLASYDVSELTSGVEQFEKPANSFTAIGTDGAIRISVSAPTLVSIYNLSGQKVAEQQVAEETLIALPAGFYIVNGKKVIVR